MLLVDYSPLWETALFLYCIQVTSSLAVARQSKRGKKKPREETWVYGITTALLAGFGGGVLNPILLGVDSIFPFPMASDVVVPFVAIGWFLAERYPRKAWLDVVSSPLPQLILSTAFELVRSRCKHKPIVVSVSFFGLCLL
jgi:hypothetical protein